MESHVMANQQVRFGSKSRDDTKTASGDTPEDRSRFPRTSREGRHTTSTPTGSDQEQRLKEEFEGVSAIKEVQPLHRIPGPEVRMCRSHTESSG